MYPTRGPRTYAQAPRNRPGRSGTGWGRPLDDLRDLDEGGGRDASRPTGRGPSSPSCASPPRSLGNDGGVEGDAAAGVSGAPASGIAAGTGSSGFARASGEKRDPPITGHAGTPELASQRRARRSQPASEIDGPRGAAE